MPNNKHTLFLSSLVLSALILTLAACSKNAEEKPQNAMTQTEQRTADTQEQAIDKAEEAAEGMAEKAKELSMDEKLEKMAMQTPDMTAIFEDGDKYLEWYSKLPNVQQTDSGLLYRVKNKGTGPKPSTENKVSVHYRGTFPNGDEFDSSYKDEAKPIQFKVTGVIKGWTEMLLLMNEGDKVEVVIPPELAYGQRGAGGVIPPNQVLKFDIELLEADFK